MKRKSSVHISVVNKHLSPKSKSLEVQVQALNHEYGMDGLSTVALVCIFVY